jgi:hypothetical protein
MDPASGVVYAPVAPCFVDYNFISILLHAVAQQAAALQSESAPNVSLFRPGKWQSYLSQNQHDQPYAPSTRAREIGERTTSV